MTKVALPPMRGGEASPRLSSIPAMFDTASSVHPFWPLVSRLGEAQILLPAALAFALWFVRRGDARPLVRWWLMLLGVAIAVTTVSKVAFLGYGIGSVALDFTGVSGHAMFASAVYPLLAAALVASRPPRWQAAAVVTGFALALLIGVSRLAVGAHSWSEVLAGLALGGAASATALALAHTPHTRAPWLLPIGLAMWLSVTPAHAPPSQTHSMVTRLALALSGRSEPYTRRDMRRAYELSRRPMSAGAWH